MIDEEVTAGRIRRGSRTSHGTGFGVGVSRSCSDPLMLPSERMARPRHVGPRPYRRRAAFVAVLLLATVVRVAFVERHGLWADELFSLAMATGHSLEHSAAEADPALGDFVESPRAEPVSAYARYLEHDRPPAGPGRVVRAVLLSDTSPPLYYLLLHVWTRAFGTSDGALGALSVLASLCCLPFLWQLARVFGGRAAAIPATLLFSLGPPSVYYSTEGRMYALLWLFTVALAWQTWRMARSRAGPASAALWIAVGAAGLLTHYFFVFVWAAAVLWLLMYPGPWKRRAIGQCAALTLLLIVPWYLHVPESLGRWRVTAGWLQVRPDGFSRFAAGLRLPWRFLSLRVLEMGPARWDWLNLAAYLALAAISLGRGGLPRLSRPRRLLAMWLLAACLGPIVWDAALGTYTLALPRYTFAGMPAAYLVVGLMAARLRPILRLVFTAPIVVLCAIGLLRLGRLDSRNETSLREMGTRLAREARTDDLVLVHSIPSGICGLARYMREALGAAPGPGIASWVGQLGQRHVPEDLQTLAAGRGRVFFVDVHAVGAPAPEREWLEAHASLVETGHREGGAFLVFAPRDGPAFFPSPSPTPSGR